MHDREHKAPEPGPVERSGGSAPPRAPGALALQRQIGNRAFGQLVARTPEESVELLEPALGGKGGPHPDVDQINRTLLPYSRDQESFDKLAEAFEAKTETPLKGALEARLDPEDLFDVNKRVPLGGFPKPGGEAAGG